MQASNDLSERLCSLANADGGWGYAPGLRSRTEPTAWAALALALAGSGGAPRGWTPDAPLAWLRRLQTPSGLLAGGLGLPASYAASALAALAVEAITPRPDSPWVRRLTEAIISGHGLALAGSAETRQRNTLQGWPWVDGCFSWAEPTAWCLLLLKRRRLGGLDRRASGRIDEAERLLIDRACAGGGWNYGNADVLGQSLDPFVPTTAIVLLALQDRRDFPAVAAGLSWLQAHATSEPSVMALALARLCLAEFGIAADAIDVALRAALGRPDARAQIHASAVALCALTTAERGEGAFHVA